jgi:hypothetical protein
MNENFSPEVLTKITEAFGELGSANIDALQQVRDVHAFMGPLLQHEARRLEKKLGKDNPRVQQIQTSSQQNQTLVRDLAVELEIAKIRAPEVDPKDSLIQGRVVDENRRGWSGLTVSLVNTRGQIVRALGSAQTQVSGYYALPIQAEVLKQVAESIKEGVFVVVCNTKGELIYRQKDPLILVGGDRYLVEIVLQRSDLTPRPCDTPPGPVDLLSIESPTQPTSRPDSDVGDAGRSDE